METVARVPDLSSGPSTTSAYRPAPEGQNPGGQRRRHFVCAGGAKLPPTAFFLVLMAAIGHSTWNLLAKRAGATPVRSSRSSGRRAALQDGDSRGAFRHLQHFLSLAVSFPDEPERARRYAMGLTRRPDHRQLHAHPCLFREAASLVAHPGRLRQQLVSCCGANTGASHLASPFSCTWLTSWCGLPCNPPPSAMSHRYAKCP